MTSASQVTTTLVESLTSSVRVKPLSRRVGGGCGCSQGSLSLSLSVGCSSFRQRVLLRFMFIVYSPAASERVYISSFFFSRERERELQSITENEHARCER